MPDCNRLALFVGFLGRDDDRNLRGPIENLEEEKVVGERLLSHCLGGRFRLHKELLFAHLLLVCFLIGCKF